MAEDVYNVIGDGDVDPDSPVSTNLMTDIRDDLDFLRAYVSRDDATTFFVPDSLGGGKIEGHDHDGADSKKVDANNLLNLGAVQGALTLVGTDSAASNQTDITFSSLDGETDGQYLLIARFKNPSVSVTSYTLRLNTDDGDGTIITLSQNEFCTLFALIYPKRINESVTFEPAAFFHAVEDDGTAATDLESIYTTIAANVTDVIIHGSVGGDNIGIGSSAQLYKFKQS